MFEIIEKKRYGNYILKDVETGNQCSLIFQFFGVEPKVGDKISLHKKLLDKTFAGFSQPYTFEPIKRSKDALLNIGKDLDLAVLVCGGKKILAKRVYGWWV